MNKQFALVSKYYEERGHGFLQPALITYNGDLVVDRDGPDIFVHAKQLQKSGIARLFKGDRVRFRVHENNGRPQACDVELVEA